ncbi:MAG TPA: PQQ-dependent sugar dehydrogenase [Candidatus Thermoplasmatota archaeon]|nr:PQQ-dependent sugar dehydrogenase [Candidatus Thermoplasmatota archaeon]
MRPRSAMLLCAALAALAASGCSGGPGGNGGGESSTGDREDTRDDGSAPELHLVAKGFPAPLYVTEMPGSPGRLVVVEQQGTLRLVEGGAVRGGPFLDLTDRVGSDGSEQGLLGLAFHPGFAGNGVAIVGYTDKAGDSVVSRFRMRGDGTGLDSGSEEVLLQIDQPFDNHNGGHLLYGPDGYLYLGFGDGGLGGDPNLNGQNKGTLLGDLLRLDVGESGPYGIPPDNPYAGGSGGQRPEIWASGLRNPWRFHFDRATGDLWIADVGQNLYEEVNVQPAGVGGLNYGWNLYEGNHQFPSLAPVAAPVPGFTFPAAEYDHADGRCSVTGGPVYRGAALPDLVGATLYADYCSGTIWRLDGPEGEPRVLLEAGFPVSSFGEDSAGEVYVLDYAAGRLLKLA